MKNKYLLLVLTVCAYLGFYLFYPISVETAMKRANDEFSFYCTDLNMDCSSFSEVGLVKSSDGLHIYQWEKSGEPNVILQVRVPYKRIGDLTFGLLGPDVTLGTL